MNWFKGQIKSKQKTNTSPFQPVRSIPLQFILIIPFVIQIFGAVGLVGYFSFRNGQKSVQKLAQQLMVEVEELTLVELVLCCKVELELFVDIEVELVVKIKVDWVVELEVKLCSVDSLLIDVELVVMLCSVLVLDDVLGDEVSD